MLRLVSALALVCLSTAPRVVVATPGPRALQEPPAERPLSLAAGSAVVDFGPLLRGTVARRVVPFLHDGDGPLVLSTVRPNCGCLRASVHVVNQVGERVPYTLGQRIPRGKRFEVLLALDTAAAGGLLHKEVLLHSNAPGLPFRLQVEADVRPPLFFEPPLAALGAVNGEDRVTATVRLATTTLAPFRVALEREGVPAWLAVDLAPFQPDAEGRARAWRVSVTAGPGVPLGRQRSRLRFVSDRPVPFAESTASAGGTPATHEAVLAVEVDGVRLSVEPASLDFGSVAPGAAVERRIRIESHDSHRIPAEPAVRITGLGGRARPAVADAMSWEHRSLDGGRVHELVVRLEGLSEQDRGWFGGVLHIEAGHPEEPELPVRFSGSCRGSG